MDARDSGRCRSINEALRMRERRTAEAHVDSSSLFSFGAYCILVFTMFGQ